MVRTNPSRIKGKWLAGYALDLHTVSSIHLGIDSAGHDVFETERTELGELLYQLKYRGDRLAAQAIVEVAAEFVKTSSTRFDMIVPVPPSGIRDVQPVLILAEGIGEEVGIPVVECVTLTRSATQLKGVLDPAQRRELLDGLHHVDVRLTRGKNILVLDDLFRSGSTLNAITEALIQTGKAKSVRTLTITRTRRNT